MDPEPTAAATQAAIDKYFPLVMLWGVVTLDVRVVTAIATADAAILLGELHRFSNDSSINAIEDGWFTIAAGEIERRTGLIPERQDTARKQLQKQGVIKTRRQHETDPMQWRIDADALLALILEEKS